MKHTVITDMDLFYRLAHQLDRDTFDEIYPLVSKVKDYSNKSLIDMIEMKRKQEGLSRTDITEYFGISRQAYALWVSSSHKVPDTQIEKASELLGIDLQQAQEANSLKIYDTDTSMYSNQIRELEKYRLSNNLKVNEFAKKLSISPATYKNWLLRNKIPNTKVNQVSIITGIEIEKLITF